MSLLKHKNLDGKNFAISSSTKKKPQNNIKQGIKKVHGNSLIFQMQSLLPSCKNMLLHYFSKDSSVFDTWMYLVWKKRTNGEEMFKQLTLVTSLRKITVWGFQTCTKGYVREPRFLKMGMWFTKTTTPLCYTWHGVEVTGHGTPAEDENHE